MQRLEHIRKLDQKLGVGAHGVVYLGYDERTGGFVAIKEIAYDGDGSGGSSAVQILQEMRVMQLFQQQHDCLVGYHGARRSPTGVQLVMEYMGGGSLERLLELTGGGGLPEPVACRYAHDILLGLRCLHDGMAVCHRDVKPANVMLTPEGRCKLADFGVSKMLAVTAAAAGGERNSFMQTTVGTPWYMAPEVISGGEPDEECGDADGNDGHQGSNGDQDWLYYNPLRGIAYCGGGNGSSATSGSARVASSSSSSQGYSTSADIWSLGVTVYEMVGGQRPFGGGLMNPAAVMFRIVNSASQPPKLPEPARSAASKELRNFLSLCFVYDRTLRPSAAELLAHPWIAAAAGTRKGGRETPTTIAGGAGALGIERPSQPPQLQQQQKGSRGRTFSPMVDATGLLLPSWSTSPSSAPAAAAAACHPAQHQQQQRLSRSTSGGGGGASVASDGRPAGQKRPVLPVLPAMSAAPGSLPPPPHWRHSSSLVTSEGFFSVDGHFVDLIDLVAHAPSAHTERKP